MSHFSTIKTTIKNKPELVEALELLQYNVVQDVKLENPLDHEHKQWNVDVAINDEIGFKLNNSTGTYELVADEQTWDLDVPVQRFIDQVTQQYARMTIHNTVKDLGYQVEEEWEMDDLSIEITATVWE
jgi:hypothetical protein